MLKKESEMINIEFYWNDLTEVKQMATMEIEDTDND